MTIELPDIRSNFEGFSQLADLAAKTKDCVFDTIDVDMADVYWFDANMSAPLGLVLAHIAEDFNTVRPVNLTSGVQSILAKNLFLETYGFPARSDNYGT